jgi:hypothetical protein
VPSKMKSNAKKSNKKIAVVRPKKIEITILDGVNIHDEESLREALEFMEEAQAAIKPILDSITVTRNQATTYMHSHAVPVVQLKGRYWRKIQRKSRFWVATDSEMPSPKPRGAESLKSLCQGRVIKKKGKKDVSLWNFITRRVIDPAKIQEAVALGYLTEKEIGKAYLEADQAPFIQRFAGEALDGENDAEG